MPKTLSITAHQISQYLNRDHCHALMNDAASEKGHKDRLSHLFSRQDASPSHLCSTLAYEFDDATKSEEQFISWFRACIHEAIGALIDKDGHLKKPIKKYLESIPSNEDTNLLKKLYEQHGDNAIHHQLALGYIKHFIIDAIPNIFPGNRFYYDKSVPSTHCNLAFNDTFERLDREVQAITPERWPQQLKEHFAHQDQLCLTHYQDVINCIENLTATNEESQVHLLNALMSFDQTAAELGPPKVRQRTRPSLRSTVSRGT